MTTTEGEPGRLEAAVQRDIARLGSLDSGARGSLAELAVRLARAIDGWVVDGGSAATMSAMAKAHQELRATLGALMEVADVGDRDEAARLSTPEWGSDVSTAVRDSEVAGAADIGESGGGGSAAAG